MEESSAYKIKGMISYPCCANEKVLVYENTVGYSSCKCPRCGKYAIFDYDRMTSRPSAAIRGATRKLNR